MSSTTFDAMFDFRTLLENGFTAAIQDDLSTYTRLNAAVFQKDRARFEFICKVGAANGHRKIITPTDRRYDQFNFTCSCNVITRVAPALQRLANESDADYAAREQQQNSFHTQLIAHVDAFMSQIQLSSIDDLITWPIVTLLMLRGTGHVPELKPQEGTEITKLNYAGQFGIRAEAWPAS